MLPENTDAPASVTALPVRSHDGWLRTRRCQPILHLEATLNKTWNTHDLDTAKRLIADDFRGISSSGHPLTKAEILRTIEHNDEASTDVSDEQVRVFPEIAIYTALITDHDKKPDGSESIVRTRVTDIWALRKQQWLLVGSQETVVKD